MRKCPSNITAIIPTYNNGRTIADIVCRTCHYVRHVIVVVDGSTDETICELSRLQNDNSVLNDSQMEVIHLEHNHGKGDALKIGFERAIEEGFLYALTLDGDGQHFPEDIPLLVDKELQNPGSLVVGSRVLVQDNMPRKNTFANRFSNFWFCLQTGLRLPDTQSGMRIYPLNNMGHFQWMTSRYESELELLVFAAWRNVPIYNVPIRVYYPPREERVSHFRPAYDFTRISILNTLLCLMALFYGLPRRYALTPYKCLDFWITAHRTRKKSSSEIQNLQMHVHEEAGKLMSRNGLTCLHVGEYLNADAPTPRIIIANHTSLYDVLVVLGTYKRVTVLVQDWVYSNPFFGKLAEEAHFYEVKEGFENLLEKLREDVKQGYSILVFPEGHRSADGDVHRFHRGAFYLAEQLNLPIQPLLIRGMYGMLPKTEFRYASVPVSMEEMPLVMPNDSTFGTGYRARTIAFQRHYHALLRTHGTALIMGGGVGGLFTGALLAQEGWRVTVIEQLPIAGGGLYSYERVGETWMTGVHTLCSMDNGEPLRQVLDELHVDVPVIKTDPDIVHGTRGEGEELDYLRIIHGLSSNSKTIKDLFAKGSYRIVGGSEQLADALVQRIVEHGGRVVLGERVTRVQVSKGMVVGVETHNDGLWSGGDGSIQRTYTADVYISSLHPKKLCQLVSEPVFRKVTMDRLMKTKETFGSMKVYVKLLPERFPYLKANHYILPDDILVVTPLVTISDSWARTMEIVQPLDYEELTPWHYKRDAEYEAFKTVRAEALIHRVNEYLPGLTSAIDTYFTSTSLTYRDDYMSPQGAMYGLQEPVGAVTTHLKNLFLTGQNCLLHGVCGTAMTAKQLSQQLCAMY